MAESGYDHFLDLVANGDLMPFAGNYLLTELSLSSRSYLDMEHIAAQLISRGLQPILAHPERYLYWSKSFALPESSKESRVNET